MCELDVKVQVALHKTLALERELLQALSGGCSETRAVKPCNTAGLTRSRHGRGPQYEGKLKRMPSNKQLYV